MKPVRIPPEIGAYAESHRVLELVEGLVRGLVIEQPADPLEWLLRELKRREPLPRVLLLGPPAVGKRTLAARLAEEIRTVHVTTDSLLEEYSELNNQARAFLKEERELPPELLTTLVQQRLQEPDCFNRGWVLDGVVQNRLQALALQRAGVLPEHVVLLEAPQDVLVERNHGRRLDPQTGEVYHELYIWPEDPSVSERLVKGCVLSEGQLLSRLHRYQCEVTGLTAAYTHSLKVFNSDQPHEDLHQQVLAFIQTRACLRTPRVLLLGPPGAGKSLQAHSLCSKYGLVNVSCSELLRAAASLPGEPGAQIKAFLELGRPVPDSLVLQVLENRLSSEDCSRGWVLHDFPSEVSQARALKNTLHHPNRVFFMELSSEESLHRVSLRSTDPVSGNIYHSVTTPAPSTEVQSRLQTRPSDQREAVLQRLQHYSSLSPGLQTVYPDGLHISAEQDPHSVFEILEKKLTTT